MREIIQTLRADMILWFTPKTTEMLFNNPYMVKIVSRCRGKIVVSDA